MNPGAMDRRIIIQRSVVTRDAVGGVTETWEDQFSVWAEIPRQAGNESAIADADRSQETRQFRIRYRTGIASNTHRVSYQSKIYDIRHIQEEMGRSNRLLITAVWNQSIT
jgi:SPP1 family predicted phage head-tail adaptor